MRTKSSWETCSGNTTWWTFSPPSATNYQTTSPPFRCVRTLRTHRTPQMLSMPLNLVSFTAGYHHPGGAAVLGRNLLRHDELALSQSVRSLQSSLKRSSPTVHVQALIFSWLVSLFPVLQPPKEVESYCCRIDRWEDDGGGDTTCFCGSQHRFLELQRQCLNSICLSPRKPGSDGYPGHAEHQQVLIWRVRLLFFVEFTFTVL